MIKHKFALFVWYLTLYVFWEGGGAKRKQIQLYYYVFIFLHQVNMFFQYIANEVPYVYKSSL
jgi:hypothetical protein